MLGFKEFLLEKLVTFGNKAYPKFGNIVILAGGAGSGKGFVSSNLLGIEGITFDVDKLKEMSQGSTKFAAEVKRQTGIDIKKLNFSFVGICRNSLNVVILLLGRDNL